MEESIMTISKAVPPGSVEILKMFTTRDGKVTIQTPKSFPPGELLKMLELFIKELRNSQQTQK